MSTDAAFVFIWIVGIGAVVLVFFGMLWSLEALAKNMRRNALRRANEAIDKAMKAEFERIGRGRP